MSERPTGLLFLCVANSARSQMAEAIARSLAPAGLEVFSAGTLDDEQSPGHVAYGDEHQVAVSFVRGRSLLGRGVAALARVRPRLA